MDDILSALLQALRLKSVLLSRNTFGSPWGFDKAEAKGSAPFHLVIEGSCFFSVIGEEPIPIATGDFVVLPHGNSHALQSDRQARRVPFKTLLEAHGFREAWSSALRYKGLSEHRFGSGKRATRLISGVFTFDNIEHNPLLDALPIVIHVKAAKVSGSPIRAASNLLVSEAKAGRPGGRATAERIAEVMFLQAIQHYVESTSSGLKGWLRGMADPQIKRALVNMYQQPAERWTVASLAREAGLSRTLFANRFRELLGFSPITYLGRLRMNIAASKLLKTSESMGDIAAAVGYDSEISFSRAFRRWMAVPPGRYRRRDHSQ